MESNTGKTRKLSEPAGISLEGLTYYTTPSPPDEAAIRRAERKRILQWTVRYNLLACLVYFTLGPHPAYIAWVLYAIAVTVYWFRLDAS
jgi:hypothetical protein